MKKTLNKKTFSQKWENFEESKERLLEIGSQLAMSANIKANLDKKQDICVICSDDEADFFAEGFINELSEKNPKDNIKLFCSWVNVIQERDFLATPIYKTYVENFNNENPIFCFINKGIEIEDFKILETNIMKFTSNTNPEKIVIISPIQNISFNSNLRKNFPENIANKFEFIHLLNECDTVEFVNQVKVYNDSFIQFIHLLNLEKNVPDIISNRRKMKNQSLS